jgi:low temperature requirement protein LtrA
MPERGYEVTPLELFFDLVFVFAVAQLSRQLLTNLSWIGGLETLVMLRATFAVWYATSWAATMVRADQVQTRWMVLTVMPLGLFMNASVTGAFGASSTSGWAFVVPLLLVQIGRTIWTLVHSPDAVFRDHYFRTLLWFVATSPLWIAGAALDPADRLIVWLLAAGSDQIGTWLAHPVPGRRLHSVGVEFDAYHMLERCRQFLLIALGETVFTTGTAVAAAPMTLMTLATGTAALAGTVALWALGFGRSHHLILGHAEETRDPVRASRHAVNALMALVAGLIAVAVANQMVIAHPLANTSIALSLLLFGGPALFLAAQGWYLWAVPHVSPRLHLAGIAALAVLGCAAPALLPFAALILCGAGLLILVLVDSMYAEGAKEVENA